MYVLLFITVVTVLAIVAYVLYGKFVAYPKNRNRLEHKRPTYFCDDCPDREACSSGMPCWFVREANRDKLNDN